MSIEGAVGKTVVSFLLPKGWNWLVNQLTGKKVLIVGPGRSGKTSFKNYLLKGILLNQGDTPKTALHNKVNGSILSINDGAFEIKIKSLTDSPGQIGPLIHADSVQNFRPHFLFVFLNCGEIQESLKWFQDFSECLYTKFRDFPNISLHIKSIIIVLNKYDQINGENEKEKSKNFKRFKSEIKKIALDELNDIYYKAGVERKTPSILPAISVRNSNSKLLLEEIINTMASKV